MYKTIPAITAMFLLTSIWQHCFGRLSNCIHNKNMFDLYTESHAFLLGQYSTKNLLSSSGNPSHNTVTIMGNTLVPTVLLAQQESDSKPRGCFTNVSRALQNNFAKIYNARNNIYAENFKLNLCTCAQSHALGTCTKFQLELLMRRTILVIYKFWENVLESSQNIRETPPWLLGSALGIS